MRFLRTSASDIDAFRRYLEGDEMEIDALLRQLRKEEPPTESMLTGTALHKALEEATDGPLDKIDVTIPEGTWRFTFDLDGDLDLPSVREFKATREYDIGDTRVTLVGKVDALHGKRIDDHKYTSRYDAERFLSSYQWRIYLEVFEADEFRWNIFEGREIGDHHYVIYNLHKLTMHRYPGIGEHVGKALVRFVDFAREFLPERFTEEANPNLGLSA